MRQLEVRLLGGFEVLVDGRPVPADAWAHRRATDLVKVLALARPHRVPRERVLEALWPSLEPDAAAANLHKAASYARRAIGDRGAIVLRAGMVELAPSAAVATDVERFEAGDDAAYRGELLPDDAYEPWAVEARERLRGRRLQALRAAGRWEDVLAEDPADEAAHRGLMRSHADRGDRAAAAGQYRRLVDELARFGCEPAPETAALRAEVLRGPAVHAVRLLRDPLEARGRELEAAGALLRRAASGDGGALLVTGPPGVGKTRLVEALLGEAEALGWHTLRGAAHAEEGHPPYAPVVEALDPLVARRPELASELTDGVQETLARLLPSVGSAGPEPVRSGPSPLGSGQGADRHRVFFAVVQLLLQAAEDRGVVLALDGFHAADEATAALVHHLARTAVGRRMLVVAALRDEALPRGVAAVRASLVEHGAATELALAPLPRDAIAAIAERAAGRRLPAAALRAIERSAAGIPLFAEELARSVDASGEVSVPPRLRAIVARRLEALDGVEPQVAAALAVADDGFTENDLAALAGRDAGDVEPALAAAVAAGVLDVTGGRHRFRHALARDELAARAGAEDLRRLHAAAAARLEAEDAPPEAVAHHLVRAGRPRDAVPLLERAAAWAASVGAYRDGAEWAEQALEHAEDRASLLALRAQLLHGAGDTRAPAAYAAAIAAASPGEVPALRAKQARACLATGDLAGAEEALEGIGSDEALASEVLVLRGLVAWHRGDREGASRLVAEAESEVMALPELATLRAMVAHLDGAWELRWGSELAEVWDTPDLTGRVYDGYLCVTEYVLGTGEPYDRVAGFAKRLHAQATRCGARRGEAFAATLLGETELLAGNLDAARAHLADAVRLSREVGAVTGECLARVRLGEALLHAGDRPGARAQLDRALELAHVSRIPQHLLYHVYGGLLQAADGDAEALALIDRAEALFEPSWLCRFCPIVFHVAAATAAARAGELDRSRALVDLAEREATAWPSGSWPAAVAEARAELLLAQGDRRAAAEALRRAADGYAATGQALYERRALERLAGVGRELVSTGSNAPSRPA